jgi:hypothetical protein
MREIHEEAVGADSLPAHRIRAKEGPCIELLDEAMVEVFRRKTPVERVAMIFAANRTIRLRLEGHLRSRHPEWDDQTLIEEIARRMSRGTG